MTDLAIQMIDTGGTHHLTQAFPTFHCSGVLPYCVYGNACFFILGKTRAGKLLTYTGKSELDRSKPGFFEAPATTAAREFTEESLGAIISYEQCLEACRACDARRVLVSATPKNTVCFTFLIEVPYRRHYSSVFLKIRAFLDFMHIHDHHLCEFCEIKGVCFDTLNTKVRLAWRGSGMVTLDSEWRKIQDIANASGATSTDARGGSRHDKDGGGPRCYSSANRDDLTNSGNSMDWRARATEPSRDI